MADTDHDYSYQIVFPAHRDQHVISATLKYADVKHNVAEPCPQVYIWKKAACPAVSSLHLRASLDNYY